MSGMTVSLTLKAFDQLSPVVGRAAQNMSRAFQGFGQRSGLQLVGASLGNLGRQIARVGDATRGLSLGGIGVAFAGGAVARGVLNTAAQFERYEITLRKTLGSAERAKEAFDWISRFERQTPYDLAQATEAFVTLQTKGLDPTRGLLTALGDTAAINNKDLLQGVEAVVDAMRGEWERLKEFDPGLIARKQGDDVVLEYQVAGEKIVRTVAGTTKAIAAGIQRAQEERFGGGMAELSKGYAGLLSSISSAWQRFQQQVAEGGLFKEVKLTLEGLLSLSDQLDASGQKMTVAQSIGRGMAEALRDLRVVIVWVGERLQWAHDLFGSWQPVIGGVAAILAGPFIAAVAGAAAALIPLGVALAATPLGAFALAVGAVVAAGTVLYQHWDYLRERFGVLTAALGAPGLIITAAKAIADHWDAIAARIRGVWEGLTAAWDAVRQRLSAAWGSIVGQAGPAGVGAAVKPAMPGGAAAAKQQVGGEISVQIAGAPRGSQVTGLKSRGGIDLTAEMGPYAPR